MLRIRISLLAVILVSSLVACTEKFEATMLESKPLEVIADGDVHYEAVDERGVFLDHQTLKDPLTETYKLGLVQPNAQSKVTTILNSGSPKNRVDIVLVGDGYATNDLGQYYDDAELVAQKFLQQEPLLTYSSYINVHRVDVVSQQSGVDNDPKGNFKSTALDMNYWCSGIERLLCANMQKVKQHAANAPGVDLILALANSTTYGGAGYWNDGVATLAGRNVNAVELALHEIGHSFAKLGDEYPYAGSGTTECAAKANATTTASKATLLSKQLKWFRWLDLPHIGVFDGACYKANGVFRPTQDSKMRTLGKPLYEVNAEQFIFSIYKYVKPIEASTVVGTYTKGILLRVVPMRPVNHTLSIQWYLDGVAIPNQTGETFSTSSINMTKSSHSVSVQVVDKTTRVRDESKRQALMTDKRTWTIKN